MPMFLLQVISDLSIVATHLQHQFSILIYSCYLKGCVEASLQCGKTTCKISTSSHHHTLWCDGPNVTLFIHILSHIWGILWNRCDIFPTYTLIYEKMLIKMGKFHIYDLTCEKQTKKRCFSSVFYEWSHIYKICHIFIIFCEWSYMYKNRHVWSIA